MTTNQPLAEILESCWKESTEKIRSQIDAAIANDENFVNKVNAGSYTPLNLAARLGRLSLVNLLLEFGISNNPSQGRGAGHTPLYDAIIHQKFEVAMRLCDVTSNWKHSRIGCWGRRTELTPAEISKYEKLICKMIDSGWDINSLDVSGRNALINTFYSGTHALMPILIKMGIDVELKTAAGRTCLSVAVGREQYEACKLLIDSGANVNTIDHRGDAVLMRAAATGNVQISSLLVSSGARLNHQKKDVGGTIMTPLSNSIRHGHYDLARYFIENGANLEINLTEDQTVLGLLYDAQNFEAVLKWLEEKHEDLLDKVDDWDLNRLYYACTFEKAEKVVKNTRIDESKKIMILALCREAKAPKAALELLKFVEIFQKHKNLNGLLKSDKVKEMQIPMNILQMIASPLKWH